MDKKYYFTIYEKDILFTYKFMIYEEKKRRRRKEQVDKFTWCVIRSASKTKRSLTFLSFIPRHLNSKLSLGML